MSRKDAQPRLEGRLQQMGLVPVMERSRALVCKNLFREESALLRMGRFELVRTLGRGGMGVVYEAIDPIGHERIALKTLQTRSPSDLYRLKHEFRSLAELSHENLVTLHELFVGENDAYFTMELVSGTDFVSYARDGLPPDERLEDESRVWRALSQLCEGIHTLHLEKKLHRDIKPSNILVSDSGRVVLLDFGLVQDLNTGTGSNAGTPAYMAPEQAHGIATESSDWYGVGLMLQETLYGNRCEVEGTRGPESGLSPLEALARRLVQVEPAKRPGFAEISRMLAAADVTPSLRRASPPSSARFTGRSAEIERLGAAFRNSRRQPVAVVIRGESGIGKSALVREFCRTVLEPAGALVLSGRCYERESVPYKAFDTIIDELGRHLASLPQDPVTGISRDEAAALLHVFPVLERVGWLHACAGGTAATHPVELRTRAFAALQAVLSEAGRRRPLALCIDDLQWADADSGRLLGALLCDDDSPRLLCIATDRTDPRLTNPTVEEFRSVAPLYPKPIEIIELELRGLDDMDATALARNVLGHATTTEVEVELVRESRGSPLFLSELSRWRAERADGEVLPSVDMLFADRWARLTKSARTVLELIAAAGRPLSAAVIGHAANMLAEPTLELKVLRGARLIHTIRRKDGELLEIAHDRVGEAVLRSVEPDARVELHRRLARAIEATCGGDSEALIEQFIGARMPLEAARCARHAGDIAISSLAFSRAAWLYERALELGNWSFEEAGTLHRDHALALEHAGRGLDAAAAYARAAALMPDALDAVQVERRAVQHLMHNGRYEEGEVLLRRGYETLGLEWPSTRATLVLSIARLSLPWPLRRMGQGADTESRTLRLARVKFLSAVGRGIENYDVLRSLHNTLVCFDESEKLPDPVWQARARGTRAWLKAITARLGSSDGGLAELKAACHTARNLGDTRAQADLERKLSMVHYFRGEPLAALEAARRSEIHLRTLPLPAMDLRPIMGMIGSALMVLGRLKEARRRWDAFSHEVRLHRDLMTAAWVHGHPSRFPLFYAMEERAEAEAILERHASLRAQHPDNLTLGWTHAWCSLESAAYFRTPADAERIAAREDRALFRSGYSVLTDTARLQRGRVRVAAAAALPRGVSRAALLSSAAMDVTRKNQRGGPLGQGMAGLVKAGVAMQKDRPEEALAWLRSAEAGLDVAQAALLGACARFVEGSMVGGDEGSGLKAGARRDLDAQGIVDPVRWVAWTVPGFDAILGAGR
jgi:hypothetical protein